MKASLPIFVFVVAVAAVLGGAAAWAVQQSSPAKTSVEPGKNAVIGDAKSTTGVDAKAAAGANATYAGQRNGASPRTAAGEAAYPDADALLRQSVAQLGAAGAIEAKLRQKVNLFDRELIGAGQYTQLGAGVTARLRLEMRIGSGDRATELLQICDGETLWTFNAADGKRSLRRVDLDRIQAAIERDEKSFDDPRGRAGQGGADDARGARERVARGTPIQSQSFGIGGLPWMLDGLRLNCNFSQVAPKKLGELEVLALHGVWRKEKVLRLLADDEKQRVTSGGEIDPDKLPAHLADQIVVYLGRDDLFPYRVDYLRSVPLDKKAKRAADATVEAAKSAAANAGAENTAAASAATPEFRPSTPVMTLELYEVRFGGKLDRQMFTYKPGQPAIDDTQRHLDRLK